MTHTVSMREKFHGALVGGVIGDCLGALFEFNTRFDGIKREKITKALNPTKKMQKKMFEYTDDTAMALSVCKSLLNCKKFDAVHMAKSFANEYKISPNRGYGAAITDVFDVWNNSTITTENVFQPSIDQFDGMGSYGNGAAMRVSPVALFAKSKDECIKISQESAMLTHSHRCGVNGAILQALALYEVLHSTEKVTSEYLLSKLKKDIELIESQSVEKQKNKGNKNVEAIPADLDDNEKLRRHTRSDNFSFSEQLDIIKELLKKQSNDKQTDDVGEVIRLLGCDVTAQQAVPTALYCFLRNIDKGFEETLYYSISIGGDTDTISTMSCSLAGAYYGIDSIPQAWTNVCEAVSTMKNYAEESFISKTK